MRSVPHRVVCLLGLDDDAFPRKAPRDGDDLLLDDPWIGERDPRSEDRQLLLDALMAASERLIITYTGNDERTNKRRPPAVPVGELLDTIDDTARCEGDPATAASVRVRRASIRCSRLIPATSLPARSRTTGPGALTPTRSRARGRLSCPEARSSAFLPAPLPAASGRDHRAARPDRVRRAPGAGIPATAARGAAGIL